MKPPNVKFRPGALEDLLGVGHPAARNPEELVNIVASAIDLAETMTGLALEEILEVLSHKRLRAKRRAWNAHPEIKKYFGEAPLSVAPMNLVAWRMSMALNRLSNKSLTVRVQPQSKGRTSTSKGRNLGGSFSANTFTLYRNWFYPDKTTNPHTSIDLPDRSITQAATIVHELFHEWFNDMKIKHNGKRVTVYGLNLALKLAKEQPWKARVSAENCEWFCIAVYTKPKYRKAPNLPDSPIKKGDNSVIPKKGNNSVIPKKGTRKPLPTRDGSDADAPQPRKKSRTRGRLTLPKARTQRVNDQTDHS